ncbi:MAG: superoxide dismutase [Actinomycetota bacterium]|nr:superoxide dismutase [Actinomycetota bacterium]
MRGRRWGEGSHTALRRLLIVGTVMAPIGYAYQGISIPTPAAAVVSPESAVSLFGSGTLTTPNPVSQAITYDPDLAAIGAAMTASLIPSSDGSTRAELTVSGLLPNRGYAAHAHTKACGVAASEAGPNFQNHIDPRATPQSPSSNPRYANPNNEIWLDVRTDSAGAGTSSTTLPFVLTDRVPGSIVMHEGMRTLTDPGHAGTAGTRIACLTLAER